MCLSSAPDAWCGTQSLELDGNPSLQPRGSRPRRLGRIFAGNPLFSNELHSSYHPAAHSHTDGCRSLHWERHFGNPGRALRRPFLRPHENRRTLDPPGTVSRIVQPSRWPTLRCECLFFDDNQTRQLGIYLFLQTPWLFMCHCMPNPARP